MITAEPAEEEDFQNEIALVIDDPSGKHSNNSHTQILDGLHSRKDLN